MVSAGRSARVVSKIPIAVWSCALRLFRRLFPFASSISSRVLFLLLFFFFLPPARPPEPVLRLRHRTLSHRALFYPIRLLPPALRGLSPRFTRASANLFRRLGDGGRRNRSTLYSSRIDRQPRTDMEALYFPLVAPSCRSLESLVVNIESTFLWHGLSLFLSLPAIIQQWSGCLSTIVKLLILVYNGSMKYLIAMYFSIINHKLELFLNIKNSSRGMIFYKWLNPH